MNAAINSLGIASGNAGLIVPIGLFCIMPIMYLILKVILKIIFFLHYIKDKLDGSCNTTKR